ncbi:hypothetical protein GCM10009540_15010 [Streptomyces turgidiscabies]
MTQENGCEPVEIGGNPALWNIDHTCPFVGLPVVPGVGEKLFQPVDVTDRRLLRAPVQPGRAALLQAAAVRGLRTDLGVMTQAAVLVEERREGRHPRSHRLHHRQWCLPVATTGEQNAQQCDGQSQKALKSRFPESMQCHTAPPGGYVTSMLLNTKVFQATGMKVDSAPTCVQ